MTSNPAAKKRAISAILAFTLSAVCRALAPAAWRMARTAVGLPLYDASMS